MLAYINVGPFDYVPVETPKGIVMPLSDSYVPNVHISMTIIGIHPNPYFDMW